jgi:hypothetical protein
MMAEYNPNCHQKMRFAVAYHIPKSNRQHTNQKHHIPKPTANKAAKNGEHKAKT